MALKSTQSPEYAGGGGTHGLLLSIGSGYGEDPLTLKSASQETKNGVDWCQCLLNVSSQKMANSSPLVSTDGSILLKLLPTHMLGVARGGTPIAILIKKPIMDGPGADTPTLKLVNR